jgi:hypothetical protein
MDTDAHTLTQGVCRRFKIPCMHTPCTHPKALDLDDDPQRQEEEEEEKR